MITLKHGRQDVVFADIDFDYTLLASGANPAVSLPGNAEIVSGSLIIDTAFNAGTTIAVGDVGATARYLAAKDATVPGFNALAPTGYKLSAKGTVDLLVNQAVTAGAGRLRIGYIVNGTATKVQP